MDYLMQKLRGAVSLAVNLYPTKGVAVTILVQTINKKQPLTLTWSTWYRVDGGFL